MEGTTIIESFLYGAWIGGQALYWLFLKHQTEFLREEYWRMCLLISRNHTNTGVDTRTAGNDCGTQSCLKGFIRPATPLPPWRNRVEFVEVQ